MVSVIRRCTLLFEPWVGWASRTIASTATSATGHRGFRPPGEGTSARRDHMGRVAAGRHVSNILEFQVGTWDLGLGTHEVPLSIHGMNSQFTIHNSQFVVADGVIEMTKNGITTRERTGRPLTVNNLNPEAYYGVCRTIQKNHNSTSEVPEFVDREERLPSDSPALASSLLLVPCQRVK